MKELKRLISTFSVLDAIGNAVVVIDKDFKLIYTNTGFLNQTKYSREYAIGKYCYEISHNLKKPCYESGEECSVMQAFMSGESSCSIHTHFDKYGNKIFVENCAYPLKDEGGNTIFAIETITDVTEKVLLEQRLKESEEKYRELYNSAPEMLHSLNSKGVIIECNDTEAKTLGYRKDELIGQHITKILSPESQLMFDEKFSMLKSTGYAEAEYVFITKDGRRIPVFLRGNALHDENGNFLRSNTICTDLTELKKSLTEKATLERRLLQAQKLEAIGTLAGGIAHDFNNILTGILSYTQLADMKTSELYVKNALKQITLLCQNASDLIKHILLMGRKLPPEFKIIDLNQFLRESLTTFQRIIEKNIEIHLLTSNAQPLIKADPVQLNQALLNLTLNARDAILEKGGTIKITTSVFEPDESYCQRFHYAKHGRYAVITVSDHGPGIPEEIRDRIFEPFFTTKAIGKGSGLGLSVTYSVVKNHAGWINFHSEHEKGTEFFIYLPTIETGH
jgi:PAS domain S-box-containing protein